MSATYGVEDCVYCTYYRRGEGVSALTQIFKSLGGNYPAWCSYFQSQLVTNVAPTCPAATQTGFIRVSDLASLTGSLRLDQIPDNLITGAKLQDDSITNLKLQDGAVTQPKIGFGAIIDSKVAVGAAIAESKLALTYDTTTLYNAILLRQLLSEKGIANGYAGLDASSLVPLANIGNLGNSQIAAGAGILESKLALDYSTSSLNSDIQTRLLAATYLAHDHSLADPTQVAHGDLTGVSSDQHHAQSHSLASHSTKAHSELTDVTSDQHHAQSHTLDSHTGTLAWASVDKTGSSLADLATKDHSVLSGVTSDQHHARSHTVPSGSDHSGSGLTTGHVLRVSGATTFAWAQLQHSDLGGVSSDQHHAQSHSLASHSTKDHTELTGVTANQHHAESHTLTSHSTRAHTELTGVSSDQHHAQSHALNSHSDVSLTGALLEDVTQYTGTNAAWVTFSLMGVSPDMDNVGSPASTTPTLSNVVAAAARWNYVAEIPTVKGGLNLWLPINAIRVRVRAANGTNYITNTYIIGITTAGAATVLYTDTANYNTAGLWGTPNPSAINCSGYAAIYVQLDCVNATANALQVDFVQGNFYYT